MARKAAGRPKGSPNKAKTPGKPAEKPKRAPQDNRSDPKAFKKPPVVIQQGIPPQAAQKPGKSWRESVIAWAMDPLTPPPVKKSGAPGRAALGVSEEMCQKVHELAALGYRDQDIAQAMGIHSRTLYDKQVEFPQLALAIKSGRNEHLQGDLEHLNRMKSSQLGAVIFSMKAIHSFKEEPEENSDGVTAGGNSGAIGDRIRDAMRRAKK